VTTTERAHLERLLTSADDVARLVGRTTTSPGNHAGALVVSALDDAARGRELRFVTKPVQGGAEVAASRMSALIGIDHLVPIAVRDGEDGARMLFAAGESADAAGVTSAADLIELRVRGLQLEAPHLEPAERLQLALRDVELAQVFDYLLANSDRRGRNLLVDRTRGTFALIDNASIGHGTLFNRAPTTRPMLKPLVQGADGRTQLSPDTVEWLRAHLDESVVRAWHSEHAADIQTSADDIVARLRSVLDHGSFEFVDSAASGINRNAFSANASFKRSWS
jgi:hypothetical protein